MSIQQQYRMVASDVQMILDNQPAWVSSVAVSLIGALVVGLILRRG